MERPVDAIESASSAVEDPYENDDDGVDESVYETVWAGPCMKMVGSSTPNPKKPPVAGVAAAVNASAAPGSDGFVDDRLREEEEDDRVLRELVSKPAGHRGPLTPSSLSKNGKADDDEDEKNNKENDYVVLRFPSRKDKTPNCEANLLPKPIDGGARSEDYHALCGAIGAFGVSAVGGAGRGEGGNAFVFGDVVNGSDGNGWKSRARTDSSRLSSVSMTPPKDGVIGAGSGVFGAGNDDFFGDDDDWQKRCEEFNRGDFSRSSSTSAPSR